MEKSCRRNFNRILAPDKPVNTSHIISANFRNSWWVLCILFIDADAEY